MADVTMTEAQFVGHLGEATLNVLNTLIEEFESEPDGIFLGQDIADFLYERGANLQAKFQAKIDVLELAAAYKTFEESGGFEDE